MAVTLDLEMGYWIKKSYPPPPPQVFSLNFWWGGLKIFGPRGDEIAGGGRDLRKKSDWSQNCPLNAKLGHFLLLSLKVVKFDTKMYLNFSNFRGRTSAGGTSLGPKRGTSVGWGDFTKFSLDGGTGESPQEKPCPLGLPQVFCRESTHFRWISLLNIKCV